MNILIIGNGFDIAHKLPTKYRDFLSACLIVKQSDVVWENNEPTDEKKNKNSEKAEEIAFIMGEEVWGEFRKFINNNFWINYFQSREQLIGENWIDFEYEIKRVLELIYVAMGNRYDECISYDKLPDAELVKFCKGHSLKDGVGIYRDLFRKMLKEHRRVIRALELYMDGYVNQLDADKIPYFEKTVVDKVLSFNYTATYTEFYNAEVDCCYIHGEAYAKRDVKKCNIVLGFDDHYIKDTEIKSELIPFEKYYQRIVNGTDNQYFEWLEDMRYETSNKVIVYGHSLGMADGDILQLFIMCDKVKTVIFYYDEEDRADKIKNLAMVLGPDNLIKLTGGKNPRVQFKKID